MKASVAMQAWLGSRVPFVPAWWRGRLFGIVRAMGKLRAWGWLLLAALSVGCGASSDEGSAGYTPYGGQTGSLTPVRPQCGKAPSFDDAPALPAGDAVLVYYDDTCSAGADDFMVTDSDGNTVGVDVEQLANGALLVRTEEALAPGDYELESPGGTQTFTVIESEPLPIELGTLEAFDGCPGSLRLTFAEEVIPYLPLLALWYRVDGGALEAWYDYGLIRPDARAAELNLGWCPGPCLGAGTYEIEVVASIAGENDGPDAVSQQVSRSCPMSNHDQGGCSVARPGICGPVSGACLLFALLVSGRARRWRRGRRRRVNET